MKLGTFLIRHQYSVFKAKLCDTTEYYSGRILRDKINVGEFELKEVCLKMDILISADSGTILIIRGNKAITTGVSIENNSLHE